MILVEYLEKGSPDCPLIRIYGRDKQGAGRIMAEIGRLLRGEFAAFDMASLEGFSPVGSMALHCERAASLSKLWSSPDGFHWSLNEGDWQTVVDLLQPFAGEDGLSGYQWLWDRNDVRILYSTDGKW